MQRSKIMLRVAIFSLTVLLLNCRSSSEKEQRISLTETELIGEWSTIDAKGKAAYDIGKDDFSSDLVFKENGECEWSAVSREGRRQSGTWKLEGNTLILSMEFTRWTFSVEEKSKGRLRGSVSIVSGDSSVRGSVTLVRVL